MRIDGYNRSLTILGGDGSKHHRGFALETADFDDGALRRCASSQRAQEASLIIDEKPGDQASTFKSVFCGLIDIVGQSNHKPHPTAD